MTLGGVDWRSSARDLGLASGKLEPGELNSITDVAGIRVGHCTVIEGTGIRTGVTAVVPDGVDRAGGELPAGLFVGNGFGKLIGATQLTELGVIETPIVLTSTLSAFLAADALVTYQLALPGNDKLRTVNPVVGETNDGYLSDIRARPITAEHVLAALRGASVGRWRRAASGPAPARQRSASRRVSAPPPGSPRWVTAQSARLASWCSRTSPAR